MHQPSVPDSRYAQILSELLNQLPDARLPSTELTFQHDNYDRLMLFCATIYPSRNAQCLPGHVATAHSANTAWIEHSAYLHVLQPLLYGINCRFLTWSRTSAMRITYFPARMKVPCGCTIMNSCVVPYTQGKTNRKIISVECIKYPDNVTNWVTVGYTRRREHYYSYPAHKYRSVCRDSCRAISWWYLH